MRRVVFVHFESVGGGGGLTWRVYAPQQRQRARARARARRVGTRLVVTGKQWTVATRLWSARPSVADQFAAVNRRRFRVRTRRLQTRGLARRGKIIVITEERRTENKNNSKEIKKNMYKILIMVFVRATSRYNA